MINRMTESVKFNTIINSMSVNQQMLGKLEESIATQKKVNRPSDDPEGTQDILKHRTALNAIEQYQTNIVDADVFLSIAENVLTSLRDIVAQAKSIASTQSGTGATEENMDIMYYTVSALIDEAISLMNTKNGELYIFSGNMTDTEPFSATYQMPSISDAVSASTNTFNGTVVSSGDYTGTQNKTYVLKVVNGGSLNVATYQISADGGKTWGSLQADLSLPIILGEGINMTFTSGTQDPSSGDIFYVDGYAGGYYNGNDDNMTLQIAKTNNFVYNVSGFDAFTGPAASASIVAGQEASLGQDDTIVLTRGLSDWSLTEHENYPGMVIVSQTANTVNIDANGDAVADISLSLSGEWNVNNTATFTITSGAAPELGAVSIAGEGPVDVFATLYALKDALSTHDIELIDAQVERLQNLETQILKSESVAGAKRESLKIASSNHDVFKLQITNTLTDIESADMSTLIMEFQMRQIAMEATYNLASKISQLTILDYI